MKVLGEAVAGLVKALVFDWRAWAVAAVGGLALSLWIVTAERDRARETSAERAETVADLRDRLAAAEAGRLAAQAGKARAEAALGEYARQSFETFAQQAEASRKTAAEIAALNRRLDAAQQEIDRAPAGLRLDDPLPRGLRDALACAGGDLSVCAAVDSGGVPAGTAEPAGAAEPASGDDDRA